MILALFENWFFEMSYSAHKRTLQAKQAVQSKLEVFLKNIVPTKPSIILTHLMFTTASGGTDYNYSCFINEETSPEKLNKL